MDVKKLLMYFLKIIREKYLCAIVDNADHLNMDEMQAGDYEKQILLF